MENRELTKFEKLIIDVVTKEAGRPIPIGVIVKKTAHVIKNPKVVFSCIDYLVKSEILRKNYSGKIVLGYMNGPIIKGSEMIGTIALNAKGDGFFKKLDETESSVYIYKKNVGSAMNGDTVKIVLMDLPPKEKSVLKDGIVTEVIERNKNYFSATVAKIDGKFVVTPDDDKNNKQVVLDDETHLVDGYKILVQIANIKDDVIYGGVSRIIGHKDDVGSDVLSMVLDQGVEPAFNDEVMSQTDEIGFNFTETEDAKRKDLTDLNIVTIDPKTSKDLDDAICVVKYSNYYKLYVSIADVSYYVDLNTPLGKEAFKRATSIYLIDRVIPMLPHRLSNEICSLNPNEKRYTLTCEMDIDFKGNYLNIEVYPSIIHSKRRYAYSEVNDYFDEVDLLEKDPQPIKDMLKDAKELYQILSKVRYDKGSINFEIPEPLIIVGENGKIADIQLKKSGTAQRMIESFMVAANECVTIKFNELNPKLDFVYRTHDSPDAKKIEAFKVEAKKLNFAYDTKVTKWTPIMISHWLIKNAKNPNKELINMILLRAMQKARYQIENIGHFGLALKHYTHFTSPIRRFPDLIVHLLFRMFVFEKDTYPNGLRNDLLHKLKEICDHSSEAEIKAQTLERDVNSMKFAEFMSEKIGFEYEGFASYITSFGVFVQLENTIEGLCKPENIQGDYYVYNEEESTYVGRKTNQLITLGTKVKIRVIGANKLARKIDFEIIEFLNPKVKKLDESKHKNTKK